jgi:prolyl oligopeptidase
VRENNVLGYELQSRGTLEEAMVTRRRTAIVALVADALIGAAVAAPPQLPVAPVRPVVDDYFGVKVVDPYRWMEDRHSPEFLAWAKAEDVYARAALAAIPSRDSLVKRIEALDTGGTLVRNVQAAAQIVVYEKRGPDDDVYKLYVRRGPHGKEALLFDPNAKVPIGKHSSIDYLRLAPDGRRVAVGVSESGSEESVMRVIETVTDRTLPERIDRVEYGNPAWRADGRAFFYNRFAKPARGAAETAKYLNSRAYLHRIGEAPSHDQLVLGAGLSAAVKITPVDTPFVVTAVGSAHVLAVIVHGSAPEVSLYLARQDQVDGVRTPWHKLADVDDAVSSTAVRGDDIYLLSHKDASRYKILRVHATDPDLGHAETVVPESDVVIQELGVAQDSLYFKVLDAGVERLRRLDFARHELSNLDMLPAGGISEFSTSPDTAGVQFEVQTWIAPQRWFRFDPATAAVSDAGLAPAWRVDSSPYVAVEVQAKAADGTAIPLSLIYRRGLVTDGTHPTWLTGYGAYGISLTPRFVPGWFALLERGGVVAVAHVRGGGEFGEAWHTAGKQATKPNTYRDLIACAEYLIRERFTTSSRLAIEGSSAGGITVGMALTERPDLFRVVLSDVGDSNTLRAEYETDGDANSLEYGSVKTEAGFRALLAVDAVQHVKDGTAYPATLLTTGINDPRVAPWQPGKMTARLQAASTGARPVLLRVDYEAGHGIGSTRTQRDELFADKLAFMLWQIGDPGFQPAGL